MSTFKEQTALLDQLQKELNHVLEHTGRMFAAVSANPKVTPTAQKERLKRELPAATNRFHENLDQLEAQLHLARLVLCRDLAVIREKTAKEEPVPTNDATKAADDDVNMDIDPPAEDANVKSLDETEPKAEAQPTPDPDTAMEDIPDATDSQANKTSGEATANNGDSKDDAKPAALSLDTTSADSKTNGGSNAAGDEDSVPGTANTNADLDSLFGGPMSAVEKIGGDGLQQQEEKDQKPTNETTATTTNNDNDDDIFNFNSNPTDTDNDNNNNTTAADGHEIDFDGFGADNDNISSLLPGLQDYANPSGGDGGGGENDGGNHDFDSIFGMGDGTGGDGQTATGGGDGNGDPAPFNFDDFSFDVDAGAGGAGDASRGGDGGAGDGTVGDYDFDSIFN